MDSKEFQSDLRVRPEVLGSPALLIHFMENTSSQRARMSASALPQAEIIAGCDCSRIQTGFETKFGRYQFDESERDQDIQILEVVPKFKLRISDGQIRSNPSVTVIYLGADDNMIGCFDIQNYTELHSGFGYINKKLNTFKLTKGDFVPKETKFISAPNHDDDIYMMGRNVNVSYIPLWDTTDDAFIISESLAKQLEHTVIDTKSIIVHPNAIPLNLYGDETHYKSFPDIGDKVRDDGVLIGFRQQNDKTFLTDLTAKSLCEPEYLHDDLFVTTPGAEVIDIQVYTNHKKYPLIERTNGPYSQMMVYEDLHQQYYNTIVDIYENLKKQGYKCRPEFTNLVTKCKGMGFYRGGKNIELMNKKEPIEFIQMKITIAYTQGVSKGFKLTGIDGSKGVISAVWKDEDMPVSSQGIRADMLITAESPFNRLNCGQLIEQFINLCSEVVVQNIKSGKVPKEKAYEYILEYINDIRPVYSKFIREELKTSADREEFVKAVLEDGIYFIIPPFCNSVSTEMITRLSNKYNVHRGPITYYKRHPDGTREKIVTKYPGIIGAKYIMLLGKRPIDQLNVSEFGYVNQFMAPMKPNSKLAKAQCLHGQTPQRYGEDEVGNLTSIIGADKTARITGIYSNSPKALDQLTTCLLTDPHPSALSNIGMSDKDIILSSSNITLFMHQFCETGYKIKAVEVEKDNNENNNSK